MVDYRLLQRYVQWVQEDNRILIYQQKRHFWAVRNLGRLFIFQFHLVKIFSITARFVIFEKFIEWIYYFIWRIFNQISSYQVDLEDFVARPDRISGADVNAICQEAGMHAVRENRYIVLPKDFEKGYKNNIKKDESEHEFYK